MRRSPVFIFFVVFLLCGLSVEAQDASATGSIVVSAAATALVYVDDESAGLVLTSGELRIADVTAGQHTVRLQYGDSSESKTVTIAAGQETRLSFSYVPKAYGKAVFKGYPDGSVVRTNNVELGTVNNGTLTLPSLLVGYYTFAVSNPLWLSPVLVSGQLNDGATTQFSFEGARIIVDSLPAGTSISVNGVQVVRTAKDEKNLTLGSFPSGSYVVHASIDDERSVDVSAQIVSGKDARLSVVIPSKVVQTPVQPENIEPPAKPDIEAVQASTISSPAATVGTTLEVVVLRDPSPNLKVVARRLSAAGIAKLKAGPDGNPILPRIERTNAENFVGDKVTLTVGVQPFEPGDYWIGAREGEDTSTGFSAYVKVEQNQKVTFTVPSLQDSVDYKIGLLQANLTRVDKKIADGKTSENITTGVAIGWGLTAAAGLGVAIYGLIDMAIQYPGYLAASDYNTATSLHNILSNDMNFFVFGGIGAVAGGVSLLITLASAPPPNSLAKDRADIVAQLQGLDPEGAYK